MEKIKISLTTIIIIIILSVLCIAGITIFILRHENKPIKTISENNIEENLYQTSEIQKQLNDEENNIKETKGVTVVPTMLDAIDADHGFLFLYKIIIKYIN